MRKITKEKQFEAVKGWWNTKEVEKWDKQYDEWDPHAVTSLNRRLEKILYFTDKHINIFSNFFFFIFKVYI